MLNNLLGDKKQEERWINEDGTIMVVDPSLPSQDNLDEQEKREVRAPP